MQWYRTFAKQTDGTNLKGDFIYDHWGMFVYRRIMGGLSLVSSR